MQGVREDVLGVVEIKSMGCVEYVATVENTVLRNGGCEAMKPEAAVQQIRAKENVIKFGTRV